MKRNLTYNTIVIEIVLVLGIEAAANYTFFSPMGLCLLKLLATMIFRVKDGQLLMSNNFKIF
jgi:hypothetical protein